MAITWLVDTTKDERNRVLSLTIDNRREKEECSSEWGFKVEKLTKIFEEKNDKCALENVSFCTPSRGVTALIGTNGAGKSTTMKLLAGFLTPTRGDVYDAGLEVGYCPQYNVTWPGLTVKEHFIYFNLLSSAKGNVEPERIAEDVQLKEKLDSKPDELSGGMLRKLTFGVAMSSKPKRILLDEPTSGLDPVSRLELWEIVKNLGQHTGADLFLIIEKNATKSLETQNLGPILS